jgi:hypothetical protein
VFAQDHPGGSGLNPPDVLLPFHLLQSDGEECTDDLTHDPAGHHQVGLQPARLHPPELTGHSAGRWSAARAVRRALPRGTGFLN